MKPKRKKLVTQKTLYNNVLDWYVKHVEARKAYAFIHEGLPIESYLDSGAFDTLFDELYNNYNVSKTNLKKVAFRMAKQINGYKDNIVKKEQPEENKKETDHTETAEDLCS